MNYLHRLKKLYSKVILYKLVRIKLISVYINYFRLDTNQCEIFLLILFVKYTNDN